MRGCAPERHAARSVANRQPTLATHAAASRRMAHRLTTGCPRFRTRAHFEQHRSNRIGWLRATVLGANDGIVSTASLVLGVVMMDIGVQSTQVAGQAHVISLLPEARSRLNCIYMVTRFAGAAAGSALGAWAWTRHGWDGVCGVAIAMTVLAMGVHGFAQRSRAEE